MDKQSPILELKHITKRFGNITANEDVSLEVYQGEILALLGENGSGKTTLMNAIAGIYYPEEGQIFVNGKEVSINSPKDAYDLGIGMIHRHFKLIDVLSAAENIVLGLKDKRRYDLKAAGAKIREICDKYGFDVDPNQKIYNMSVSQKQTVEIVKVLFRGADILILDEPTAVLTEQEIDELLAIMKNLIADGKTIIIITHKLKEIQASSDVCTIIRRGKYIDTVPVKGVTEDDLATMMVGHAVQLVVDKTPAKPQDVVLDIQNLYGKNEQGINAVKDFNLQVRGGEIVAEWAYGSWEDAERLEYIPINQPREVRHGRVL